MTDEKTLDQVYEDRNHAALALAELADTLAGLAHEPCPFAACWKPDDGDDADADEWAILYVSLPSGQVSWHVPRDMAERSSIERNDGAKWDGHCRSLKNARLRQFAGL